MEQGLPVRPLRPKPKPDPRQSAQGSVSKPANNKSKGTTRKDANQEWETHMPMIKRFYIDEDRPLKEVMAIMSRDHSFHRMAKTYKYRLKQAGYMKNVSLRDPEDAKAALQLVTEGKAGKSSKAGAAATGTEIKLANGHAVSFERLAEHLRRKRLLVSARKRTVERVTRSPTPSTPSPRISQLDAPRSFRIVEQVFAKTWEYRSRRSVPDPGRSSPGLEAAKVDFTTYRANFATVMNTRDLLRRGNLQDAARLLTLAPGQLKDTLKAEPPRTLDIIFNLIVVLIDAPSSVAIHTQTIVQSLVRYLAEVSAEINGLCPELRVLFNLLARVNLEDGRGLYETAARAWKCVLDHEESISSSHVHDRVLMGQRWCHIGAVAGYHLIPPGWEDSLREECERAAAQFGRTSEEAVMLLCVLAQFHGQKAAVQKSAQDLEKSQQATEELVGILAGDIDPSTEAYKLRRRRDVYWGLSAIYYIKHDHALAEKYLRSAISDGIALEGEHSETVFGHRIQLGGFFHKWAQNQHLDGSSRDAYNAGFLEMERKRQEHLTYLQEQVKASDNDPQAEGRYAVALHATWPSLSMFTPIGADF